MSFSLPIISWHKQAGPRIDGWQSLLIALVRAGAAIEVAAAHGRALLYPGMRTIGEPSLWYQGFAFMTGFGHQAVLLFFVISGWLVGGSLLDKWRQPMALSNYAIDRASRLWTVMIPVFLLTLALAIGRDDIGGYGIDYSSTNEYSATSFIGNLLGLQLISVPTFGGNFALWSLSNETWYYILFPCLLIVSRAGTRSLRLACALAVLLCIAALPVALSIYFLIWLLGAACSRVRINCSRLTRIAVIALGLCASVYFRLTGFNDDLVLASFGSDLVLSVLFLLVLCSLHDVPAPTRLSRVRIFAIGRYLAEFSFTLYVIHVPLIFALRDWGGSMFATTTLSPSSVGHFAIYLGVLCTLIFSAWVFYLLFESHTNQVRHWLKRKLLLPASPTSVQI